MILGNLIKLMVKKSRRLMKSFGWAKKNNYQEMKNSQTKMKKIKKETR